MSEKLWIPTSLLKLQKPATLPAGSLVFVPPYSGKRTLSPAIRFDVINDDKSNSEWLFWLRGVPWGPDPIQRTASKCRDYHSDDVAVPAIVPSEAIKISVEIDLNAPSLEGLSWRRANGCVACGDFGVRIVGFEQSQHTGNSLPIDATAWRCDPEAQRHRILNWYQDWRVTVSNGGPEPVAKIPFELPAAA
jgi:hypothetical protein